MSPAGPFTQLIYYATRIKAASAGANTVTVTFSTGAAYPDVRIAEYSGARHARRHGGSIRKFRNFRERSRNDCVHQ